MRYLLFIFLLFLFSSNLFASKKTTIFILHSYSQEYPWSKKQNNGFITTLNATNDSFEYFIEYLDTKRVKLTPEYQKDFLYYLNMKYKDLKPDIIYTTDDNALNFVHDNYGKIFKQKKDIPVFFSGVNDLNMRYLLPKDSFIGVYEIKDVKKNIELIKQFSPQTRDIYFLGDGSNTYNAIINEIKEVHKEFKNLNFYYIGDENILNIQKQLPSKDRSFVLLTTIGAIKDANSNTLMPKETLEIISKNKNLIVLSMEDGYIYDGVIGGYVTTGKLQGTKTAELVLKYLINHNLKDLDSLTTDTSKYFFNYRELIKARIYLSDYIARDATIIGKDKSLIEKNSSFILNISIVTILILLLTFIVIYLILRKKYNNQTKQIGKIKGIESKLNAKDEFINNLLSFKDIGYWRFDIKSSKLFLSKELLDILGIQSNIYKDDPDVLSYFIHSSDKNIYKQAYDKVFLTSKDVVIEHRLLSSNKKIFKVKHIIYTEYLSKEPTFIVGIIKLEK